MIIQTGKGQKMVNGNEAIRSYIYDHKSEMLELWEKIVNVNIVQEEVSGNTLVAAE